MKSNLLKISLAVSFLGVFSLFLLSTAIKPKKITEYQNLTLNEKITTTGKILNIKTYDDFSIISLDNNITITCNKCRLKEGQEIQVQGTVTSYKKQLQINAEKINVI